MKTGKTSNELLTHIAHRVRDQLLCGRNNRIASLWNAQLGQDSWFNIFPFRCCDDHIWNYI